MISAVLLAVFLMAMIGVGYWGMKRTTTLADFFLGGRNIGPWFSAFAYGTTYFSAVLFIGFAGKLGWGFGLNALWVALGNSFIGALLAWMVLGRRTRIMSQNLNAMTMPEFLQERYQVKHIKVLSAAVIFIFLLPYSASVFKGLAHLFERNFHMPYDTALLLMILVTGMYLVMGGYFAVTMTDFIQGIIMLFGAVMLIAVLTAKAGGLFTALEGIMHNYPLHVPPARQPSLLMLGSLVFMTSFGVWGLPQMVQKFYAIKDIRVIPRAAVITTVFSLIITVTAYFTGALSHVFLDNVPMVNAKPAFDRLIPYLLTTYLPPWLMAIILLLILSASMSTLSSLILVSASAVAIDMYQGHAQPKRSNKQSLAMIRFLSAVFIALSYFIAKYEFALIITLMALSWGAVAGSFMAPYVLGLYWKRVSRAGVVVGMLSGLGLAIGLFFAWGPDKSPLAASVAMIVPFLVVPAVSIFTKPPKSAVIERAFANI